MADGRHVLELAIGHRFEDTALLELAITHRSHGEEGAPSNERLEFLGDAVLGLVVADRLLDNEDLTEGEMAKVRSAVVNEAALASVAADIGLGSQLLLGKGEEASGGRGKASILADAMEAVLGAVYVDAGFAAAAAVIDAHWSELIEERSATPGRRDYKTRLQEALARREMTPEYEIEGSGPDHERTFSAVVSAGGQRLGGGTGSSKKRAEQVAAREALARIEPDA